MVSFIVKSVFFFIPSFPVEIGAVKSGLEVTEGYKELPAEHRLLLQLQEKWNVCLPRQKNHSLFSPNLAQGCLFSGISH